MLIAHALAITADHKEFVRIGNWSRLIEPTCACVACEPTRAPDMRWSTLKRVQRWQSCNGNGYWSVRSLCCYLRSLRSEACIFHATFRVKLKWFAIFMSRSASKTFRFDQTTRGFHEHFERYEICVLSNIFLYLFGKYSPEKITDETVNSNWNCLMLCDNNILFFYCIRW